MPRRWRRAARAGSSWFTDALRPHGSRVSQGRSQASASAFRARGISPHDHHARKINDIGPDWRKGARPIRVRTPTPVFAGVELPHWHRTDVLGYHIVVAALPGAVASYRMPASVRRF